MITVCYYVLVYAAIHATTTTTTTTTATTTQIIPRTQHTATETVKMNRVLLQYNNVPAGLVSSPREMLTRRRQQIKVLIIQRTVSRVPDCPTTPREWDGMGRWWWRYEARGSRPRKTAGNADEYCRVKKPRSAVASQTSCHRNTLMPGSDCGDGRSVGDGVDSAKRARPIKIGEHKFSGAKRPQICAQTSTVN